MNHPPISSLIARVEGAIRVDRTRAKHLSFALVLFYGHELIFECQFLVPVVQELSGTKLLPAQLQGSQELFKQGLHGFNVYTFCLKTGGWETELAGVCESPILEVDTYAQNDGFNA